MRGGSHSAHLPLNGGREIEIGFLGIFEFEWAIQHLCETPQLRNPFSLDRPAQLVSARTIQYAGSFADLYHLYQLLCPTFR
jgi:hypothetical protein